MHPARGRREHAEGAKPALRARLLAARRELHPDALAAARAAVAAVVLARLRAADAVVAAYVPLRTEPGSVELLAALAAGGREVLVPVTLADRDLSWVRWTPGGGAGPEAGPGAGLGLDAVARADLVVVPALAVGRGDGARLGRGGGSYDRALRRTAARTVALLHAGELLDDVPSEPHDVAVGAVATPSGWFPVGPGGGGGTGDGAGGDAGGGAGGGTEGGGADRR